MRRSAGLDIRSTSEVSLLRLRVTSGCLVPGVVKPAFEFLQPVVDFTHNALDGGDCGIADSGSVQNQDESGNVARDQNQLINVLGLDWNQSQ